MNRRELYYYISNGNFAITFLQDLSRTATGKEMCNRAFNHASSVAQLVRISDLLFNQNETLIVQNEDLKKTIQDLKSGEFNDLLAKEKERLQQEFDSMKKSLITLIHDYPEIDY